MNPERLENLIVTILHPFTTAIMDIKNELVEAAGPGTNLLPTFSPFRTTENTNIMGCCGVAENRITGFQHGRPRWMNLCRQVTRLTRADAALVAVDIVTDEPVLASLEISLMTPESVTTTLRPYRYDGLGVEWLGQAVPDNPVENFGAAVEIEAAHLAWTYHEEVAYLASVKYLSDLCGCTWRGDRQMLADIGLN